MPLTEEVRQRLSELIAIISTLADTCTTLPDSAPSERALALAESAEHQAIVIADMIDASATAPLAVTQ